jgi:hypothetical protein
MKKIIIAAIAGLALATGIAAPAAATDTPPAYHLLIWEVPGGPGDIWEPDQVLADHLITDTASLDLLDGSPLLKCGSYYQADLEWNSATTDALVAGGVLRNPGDPAEDHAYGALGDGVNPWKYLTTPDCVQPDDEVTPGSSEVLECGASQWVITNWHDVVTYTGDAHGFTAQPAVRVDDPTTYRAATATDCPPAEEPRCGTEGTLACTGVEPALFVTAAAGLLGAGVYLRRRFA